MMTLTIIPDPQLIIFFFAQILKIPSQFLVQRRMQFSFPPFYNDICFQPFLHYLFFYLCIRLLLHHFRLFFYCHLSRVPLCTCLFVSFLFLLCVYFYLFFIFFCSKIRFTKGHQLFKIFEFLSTFAFHFLFFPGFYLFIYLLQLALP